MKGRFRLCGSFLPQYERYDASNRLLPLIWEEEQTQSEGYFCVIDPDQAAVFAQSADRFTGYIDADALQVSLYLLADGMLYPIGIGSFSDECTLASTTGGSGVLGYGLELV